MFYERKSNLTELRTVVMFNNSETARQTNNCSFTRMLYFLSLKSRVFISHTEQLLLLRWNKDDMWRCSDWMFREERQVTRGSRLNPKLLHYGFAMFSLLWNQTTKTYHERHSEHDVFFKLWERRASGKSELSLGLFWSSLLTCWSCLFPRKQCEEKKGNETHPLPWIVTRLDFQRSQER